ncbi:DUF3592 domain-containing protein [Streptomyces sp. NPDC026092]|uniref:DUF3592 domain-containing protein n=1 Tax=Streptomyces sp. NPDC026092 TaxID=3154797 RepID=UPI0033F87A06
MDSSWQILLLLAGLVCVAGGLREVRTQTRMRRSGVRSEGAALRHEVTSREGNSRVYSPVVGFRDEHGTHREFTSDLSGSPRSPREGVRVRVVHLPGRPETARLDTVAYKVTVLALAFGVGAVFLTVAVAFGR